MEKKQSQISKKGFTLIELLVVIAIIGVLATLAVVSLQNARKNARDAKRIADVKQMQTALELYFNDWQEYPPSTTIMQNGTIASGTVYMAVAPTAPLPADGTCTATSNAYGYLEVDGRASYSISFCLGGQTGGMSDGVKCATPVGILDVACE